MLLKYLFLWFEILVYRSNQQETWTVDSLIGQIFQPVDSCTCVPYYFCKNNTILNDGFGIIDVRTGRTNDPCIKYYEVCCAESNKVTEPIKPKFPSISVGCGHRNSKGVGFRIIGEKDEVTQFGEFPWMVAILKDNAYQCGGSLIHPQVVLTAAHCVADKSKNYIIRAGDWDSQTDQEIYPHQDRKVQDIVIHPDYYAGGLHNDIALLFLNSPVKLQENVNIICLPSQDEVIPYSAKCFATGWGKNAYDSNSYSAVLKKVELPSVSNERCQEALRKTRLGMFFKLHNSFLCAGGEAGKDTCIGDGGSPLVCPIGSDTYQQMGIVSWGIGCGSDGVPGVYANVAKFRNWIDDQIASNNFNMNEYTSANF